MYVRMHMACSAKFIEVQSAEVNVPLQVVYGACGAPTVLDMIYYMASGQQII